MVEAAAIVPERLPAHAWLSAGVISAGCFLAGVVVPAPLLLPAAVLAGIPVLRLGLRAGPVLQLRALALASLLMTLGMRALGVGDEVLLIALALYAALVVLPVRVALRGVLAGWGIGRALLLLMVVAAILGGGVIFDLATRHDVSPAAELRTGLELWREQRLADVTRVLGEQPSGWMGEWKVQYGKDLAATVEFASQAYPFLLAVGYGLVAAILMAFVPRLSGRPDDPALERFRFEELRNPFVLVFAFLIAGTGCVFASGLARFVAWNLLLGVGFLCFLQGFSVIYAFLRRLPVGRWFRWLVYFLILQPPISVAVAGVGLFDEFFEFRRFRP